MSDARRLPRLQRICTTCDLAAVTVTKVPTDAGVIDVVHCPLCDVRRCGATIDDGCRAPIPNTLTVRCPKCDRALP